MNAVQQKKLVKDIQKYDNKILDIKGVKSVIKNLFNKGYYSLDVKDKKMRYNKIIQKYPFLTKTIRHYKTKNIK